MPVLLATVVGLPYVRRAPDALSDRSPAVKRSEVNDRFVDLLAHEVLPCSECAQERLMWVLEDCEGGPLALTCVGCGAVLWMAL